MNPVLRSGLRWLCYVMFLAGATLLAAHLVYHSAWNKDRLYRRLLAGDSQQQLNAASALVYVRGEAQLLEALKSDAAPVRSLAQRALEYYWFTRAGDAAYEMMQKAAREAEEEDYQQALKTLNRLVQQYPAYAEGWNRRAAVYWQLGQHEKSIADCERALALNPNHYGAWQGLGICKLHLGQVEEACRCLRRAQKLIPHDPATRNALQRCEDMLRIYPPPDKPAKGTDVA